MTTTTVSHPMTRDCVARLPMDEPPGYDGTNAVDVTGNNHDGMSGRRDSNEETGLPGKINYARRGSGNGGGFEIPLHNNFQTDTAWYKQEARAAYSQVRIRGDMTVGVWFRFGTGMTGTDATIAAIKYVSSSLWRIDGVGDSVVDPAVRFRLYFTDATNIDIQSSSFARDTWHHVCATWDQDAQTANLYVNGALEATATVAGKEISYYNDPLYIKIRGSSLFRFDDWAIYNTAKSARWVELAAAVLHKPRTATADILRDSPRTKRRYFLKIGGVEEVFWDNNETKEVIGVDTPGFLPLTRDCVANWRMNQLVASADEPDWTGYGATATAVDNPPVDPYGVFWSTNQRARGPFNSGTRQFTVANDPRLQMQAFTVVAWCNYIEAGNVDAPLIAQDHAVRVVSWGIKNPSTGADRTDFEIWFDDGGSAVCSHYIRNQGEGWYMLTGTWDGTTARFYMGGTLQSEATPSGGSSTIDYDSSQILIGRGAAAWEHVIGPIAIYRGAKSQEWIHQVYVNSRGYSRPGINCLHLPENEFSLSLNMQTMEVDASAMTFELDNIVDPYDRSLPKKYYFSKLFAPGRIAATDVESTTLRRRELGEEQLDANATTIYAQYADNFPTYGEASIGQERLSYTGKGTVLQRGFPSNQTIDTLTGCTRGLWPAITGGNWSKPYPYPRPSDIDAGDVGNDQVISTEPYSLLGRELGLWCVAWNEDLGALYPENQAELIWAGQISEGASYNPQSNTWSLTGESVIRRLDREVGRHFPSGFVEGVNLTGARGRYWWAQFNDSNGAPYAIGSFTVAQKYYIIGDVIARVCSQMNDASNWTKFAGGAFEVPRFTYNGSYIDGVTTIRVKGTSVHTKGTLWFVTHLDSGSDMENACHAWQAMGFEIKEPFAVTFDDNASVPETCIVSQHPANHHYQPTHPDYNGRHLRAYWKGNDKLWDEQGDISASPLFRADASGPLALWRCDEIGTGQNLSDSTGNGHTATAQSAAEASITAGKFNGAQYPNGGAGGWFAAYSSNLQPQEFTISLWVSIATTLTQGKIFHQRSSGGIAAAVELRVTSGGALEFYVMHTDKTNAQCTATTSTTAMFGTWTHVQATYDGKTARLYVNGTLEDSDVTSPGDVDYQVYPTAIGRDHATTSWPFPGYLDDIALYDTAFAPGPAWFIFHNTYRHGYGSEKSEYVGAYDRRITAPEASGLPDAYEFGLAVGPTGATGGDSFDAMYHGHAGFASSIYREKPLRFQNCYVMQPGIAGTADKRGPLELLLFSLLSTGTPGYNGSLGYDLLPEPLAIGFPEELVDVESFLLWDRWAQAAGGTLAARRFYLIEKPVKWSDLWKREAQLFGVIAVWEQGQLRCKSLIHPATHLVDVTIDATSREGRDAFPAVDVSIENVANRWTIQTAHNLDGEKAKFRPTFNDVESQFGLDLISKIDIEHPGIQNHGKLAMEESIDVLLELILLDRAWLYRYAQQRVDAPLAPKEFNRIGIGDTVTYQALKHPDPFGSGEMEVNAKALVLNYQWSMKRNAGAVDLLIFSTPDDFRPWAGCALVDIAAVNGGWDAVNYRFTLVQRHFGAAADAKDGYCFNDADEVMILESAPEDQDAPQTWGPFAVNGAFETDGADLLTIETATLTGWDPDIEYVIVPAPSASAVAAQLLSNLYQASATSHLIPASTDPHRWG